MVILVELGKDLEELQDLSKFDLLVKDLRNPSKFIAAWLESETAAYCLRNKYSELYPKIVGVFVEFVDPFRGPFHSFSNTSYYPTLHLNLKQ